MRHVVSCICLGLLFSIASSSLALPWPNRVGTGGATAGLKAAVLAFKSYEKCVEELSSQLPVEASSQVLGTDPVELICRSREAAAKDEAALCGRTLKDYNQRNQCQRFFAIYVGRPNDCPVRGWPSYREGLCQALASRNPSLCLAVPPGQRALCNAILRGESHCSSLDGGQRQTCRKEAQAWRSLIKPVASTLPASYQPSLEVRATALSSGLNLPAGASQFKAPTLSTGVLLADQSGTGDWFAIDRNFAPLETYEYRSPPPLELEIQVPIPALGTGTAAIGGTGTGSAKVSFREQGSYRYRTLYASSGQVTFTRLSRTTGGQLGGTFSLELTDGLDRLKIEGQFDTFVRELIPLSRVSSYMQARTGSSSYRGQGTLSPDDVKRTQAKIAKVKETVFDVDPSIREDILKDTAKITGAASISRRYQSGGTYKGFQLYSVSQNTLLFLLGFRDNDVIQKINGKAMDTNEAFYEAYSRLRKTPIIVVTVERGGSELKLTYRVRKVTTKAKATADGVQGGVSGGVPGGVPASK